MTEHSYDSDIILNERYRDSQTGFEGVATTITFFQYACERIGLETYDPERKEIKTEIFDAPRLVHVDTGNVAMTKRPGGPQMPAAQRGPNVR